MSRWLRMIGSIVMVVGLVSACARKQGLSDDFQARMDELHHGAGSALEEAVERQVVSGHSPEVRGVLGAGEPIWVQGGKSRIIHLPAPVRRVSIGDPELAGIVVLGPRTIMINAKRLPKTRDQGGTITRSVRAQIITNKTLTPEPRVEETTFTVWGKGGAPDVHTLFVADFINQQVLLEVTVAEINRTAMEQHGVDFRAMRDTFVSSYFMGGGFGPTIPDEATTVPAQNNQPLLPLTTTTDSPVYAFQIPKEDITGFLQALQVEGLATILAQPQLLALSGQNAVFQVGGEIPIRVATGFATDIQFKPFGTLVNFVPRVSEEGDIMLTVTPEVSQPDFDSLVEGIPSFRTRRASTSTRLRNEQTLVIGGLLQMNRRETVRGVPYLKDIPFLGYIFRNTIYTDEVTELMVVVTPRIVKPIEPGVQLALPTDRGPLSKEDVRTKPHPAEAARPRFPLLP